MAHADARVVMPASMGGEAADSPLLRVLHVIPDLSRAFGGPVPALLGYLAASRAAGIRAAVVAPEPPAADLEWFRAQAGDVPVHTFRMWGRGPVRISRALLRYLRAQAGMVDVVHVHGMFNAVSTLAARSCRRAGVPYVIGPFGTLSRYTFEHRRTLLKRAYFSLLDGPSVRGAGALLFTTVEERDEARRLAAARVPPSAVVPPPLQLGGDETAPAGSRVARNASGPSDTVLFLSRLHPKKGLEILIDAWGAVRTARPGARLVIAGSGDPAYERDLRARALQSGNGDSIEFAGFLTGAQKARCLAGADVFVLPSFQENFGVAVVEAIASGVPAVVSPDVQLAAVVRQHGLGAVVRRDPADVASGILSVLGDAALRERVAAGGSALVHSLFAPDTIGLQLRAMYELARSRSTT